MINEQEEVVKKSAIICATAAASLVFASPALAQDSSNTLRYSTHVQCSDLNPDLGHNAVDVLVYNKTKSPIKVHVKVKSLDESNTAMRTSFTDTVKPKRRGFVGMWLRGYFDEGMRIVLRLKDGTVVFDRTFYDKGCAPES